MHSVAVIFYDGKKIWETGYRNVSLYFYRRRCVRRKWLLTHANSHEKLSREPESSLKVSDIHLRSKRKKKAKRDKALDTLDSFTCCIVRRQDKDRLAKRDAFNENLANFSGFYEQWITHCEILHVANPVMSARGATVKAINILWSSKVATSHDEWYISLSLVFINLHYNFKNDN